jgi:hypothetical protein
MQAGMEWQTGSAARPESPGFRRGLLFNWDATFGGGIAPVRAARRGGIVPGLHDPTTLPSARCSEHCAGRRFGFFDLTGDVLESRNRRGDAASAGEFTPNSQKIKAA